MNYWPWWAGALALGSIAVGYAKFAGQPLGVSGSMARASHPREGIADDAFQAEAADDDAALEAALLAATEAEFGPHASASRQARTAVAPPIVAAAPLPSSWAGHVLFLVMVAVGAFGAAIARGRFAIHADLGAEYARLIAGGWRAIPVLAAGGVLVGFGTRMSGGCTSGHGLSGCGRLVPSSLAATATFFGVGVVTSLALAWVAR
jgi:uncharacterized membrane protein YedE/YeeE